MTRYNVKSKFYYIYYLYECNIKVEKNKYLTLIIREVLFLCTIF